MSSAADVRPGDDRGTGTGRGTDPDRAAADGPPANRLPLMVLGWVWVGVPFAYGLYELLIKVSNLFSS